MWEVSGQKEITMSSHKYKSPTASVYGVVLKLNTLRHNNAVLPKYMSNRCFSEARIDGSDGLITQSTVVL